MAKPLNFAPLNERLEKACAQGTVTGASLSLLWADARADLVAGFAHAPERVATTPDTIFHIGSVTKCFTAELAWRAILVGRLDLGTPIDDIAPELICVHGLAGGRITLANLLGHTSGIDGDIMYEAGSNPDVLRQFIASVDSINNLFAPGAHLSYANFGYALIGRLVELAEGKHYAALLTELLSHVHGLQEFALAPEEKHRLRLAIAHTPVDGTPVADLPGPYSNIASGTILAMSPRALTAWATAQAATLNDPNSPAFGMATIAAPAPFSHRYAGWGHGFMIFSSERPRIVGHDGGTAGTSTYLRIHSDEGLTYAFSATGPGASQLFRSVQQDIAALTGVPTLTAHTQHRHPPDLNLDNYTGSYVRRGMRFCIQRVEDGLRLSARGPYAPEVFDQLLLKPLSNSIFEAYVPAVGAPVWLSFHEFDNAGRPALLFAAERMARRKEAGAS